MPWLGLFHMLRYNARSEGGGTKEHDYVDIWCSWALLDCDSTWSVPMNKVRINAPNAWHLRFLLAFQQWCLWCVCWHMQLAKVKPPRLAFGSTPLYTYIIVGLLEMSIPFHDIFALRRHAAAAYDDYISLDDAIFKPTVPSIGKIMTDFANAWNTFTFVRRLGDYRWQWFGTLLTDERAAHEDYRSETLMYPVIYNCKCSKNSLCWSGASKSTRLHSMVFFGHKRWNKIPCSLQLLAFRF